MKKLYYLIMLTFVLVPSFLSAQLSEKGSIPPSLILSNYLSDTIDVRTMSGIRTEVLLAQDLEEAKDGLPPRFGHPFNVSLNLMNSGTWNTLPNGDLVWRLQITCTDALSINLLYDEFWIPEGAKFYIHNKDKSQRLGAFTHRNNKPDRRFGTGLLYGNEVTLEYYEPKAVKNQGKISIAQIIHGYRFINIDDNPARAYEDAAACNVNTVCPEGVGWEDQIKSVAMMLLGGNRWCTGSLINNLDEDCRPLFLTANSCLNSYDAISNPVASGFTFYWRYESPNCANGGAGNDGPINETTAGAIVLANSGQTSVVTESDFAILELLENPNDNYDVFYAGWDRDPSAPNGMAAIHHPRGDVKKISLDNGTAFTSGFVVPGSTHWLIFSWETGIMEDGSNGGPLFDNGKRIVGQLSGGLSNCGNPQEDYFGRISYSWGNNGATDPRRRLKDWLDPSNIGSTMIDGTYSPCNPRPIISFDNAFTTVEEVSVLEPDCYGYQEFTINLQINVAPAEDATVSFSVGGTATEGTTSDYTISPSTIVFAAGSDVAQPLTVRVYDDAYVEATENVNITMSVTTTGRTIASLTDYEHTINIIDNDLPPHLNGTVNTYNLVTENFEDGTFPPNWTKTTVGGGPMAFMWGTAQDIGDLNSFFTVNPMNTTNMVGSNDDECGCDMSDDNLISPTFNLSSTSYAKARLYYDAYFEGLSYAGYSESAEVYLSLDGGTNWNLVDDIPGVGADGPWQTRMVDLTSAIGVNNARVKFRYSDGGGSLFGLCIDNVEVEVDSRLPSNIQVVDNAISMAENYLGPMETVHFYDKLTNDVILSIENTSNHDYGCVAVEVDRSGIAYSSVMFNSNSTPYFLASKTFLVTPEFNNSSGTYNLTLYYTDAEIVGWENATGQPKNLAAIIKANTNISTITPSNYTNYTIEYIPATYDSYTNNSSSDFDGNWTASINTGFSGFGIGVLDQNLPINLLSFTGKRVDNTALLEWQTETEINNQYFTLKHSMNGIDYQELGRVLGGGNSTSLKKYDYIDGNPRPGVNYYQLSQTDLSGKEIEAGVVSIDFGQIDFLEIFPNPVRSELTISITTSIKEKVIATIFDATGKLMKQQQLSLLQGTNSFEIEVEELPVGVYFLKVSHGNITKTRKFTKL